MKKTLVLLFLLLTPTLLFAQVTKKQILGNWTLISKHRYLKMVFNFKGFVAITAGKKDKPQALPLGIWSITDGVLKITINGKTRFIYKDIKFRGKKISARNRHGKIEHFTYTYTSLNE